jgi:hypothetical protein
VARVVTMGTPYWGAPMPWLALSHGRTGPPGSGWLPDLDSFIPDRELKAFAVNASGAFYLYPSRKYYDRQGGWLRLGRDGTLLPAANTVRAVGLYGGNKELYRRALNGHENVLDSYAGRAGLNWQMIVGTGVSTLTEVTELLDRSKEPDYTYGNGDGTVPRISAAQGILKDQTKTHYVCGVGHAALPGNSQVQQMIRDFVLTGGQIPNPSPGGCPAP